jgi:plastocyanin
MWNTRAIHCTVACNSVFEMNRLFLVLGLLLAWRHGHAAEITAEVKDSRGKPVADAVVYALPVTGKPPERKAPAVIAHQNQQFVPFVSAVEVGTLVNLPNRDMVKHHAYSISPAKPFELPLYAGTPEAPLLFDKPGIVKIGCNIHDWMTAYVCVLKTPYFAITRGDGRAKLVVPSGEYHVEIWQPQLKGEPRDHQQTVPARGSAHVAFTIELKPAFRPRRNPAASDATYR